MAKQITHLRTCASKTGAAEEQTTFSMTVRHSLRGPGWVAVRYLESCNLCAQDILLHDFVAHRSALIGAHRGQTTVWLSTWMNRANLWEEPPF